VRISCSYAHLLEAVEAAHEATEQDEPLEPHNVRDDVRGGAHEGDSYGGRLHARRPGGCDAGWEQRGGRGSSASLLHGGSQTHVNNV
jgi:hypothetical protein